MNMIELNNMPRITRLEKATVGVPSLIVEGSSVEVWNGYTWEHDFTGEPLTQWAISDDGELVKPEPISDLMLDDLSAI